ncbi:MAG: trypsin-like peptidase domain-containing protein [Bdellovibrionota bacterium]
MQILVFFVILTLFSLGSMANVTCENANECPSYIAQLQINAAVCTSFLVKNDLIATNLHCLPEELRKTGALCKNKVHFVFPASSKHPAEKFDCESIKFVSEPLNSGSFNVDLAVIKMDKATDREYLKFSQDGFKAKQKITIYKIDPTKTGGTLRKSICEPKPNSIYNPYFTSDFSPIIDLAPCESKGGNSGSPLISEDGYVRGILHSIANAPFFMVKDLSIAETSEMKLSFGTNLSCVNLDLFNYPRRNYSACDVSINPENQRRLENILRQKAFDEAAKALDQKMKTIGTKYKAVEIILFDWEVSQKKPLPEDQKKSVIARFLFSPKCVAFASAPLGAFRRTINGASSSFEIKIPYYKMVSSVNEDLIYHIDLKEEERKVKITSLVQDWLVAKKLKLKMDLISNEGKVESFDLEIPECTQR